MAASPEWRGFALGSVSYEAVVGTLVAVPDGTRDDVDDLVLELIAEIVEASSRLASPDRLAGQMLAAALTLVSGRPPSGHSNAGLADLIEYVEEGVKRSVPRPELRVVIDEEGPVRDAATVALALVQLIRNAAQHAGAKQVTLRIRRGPTYRVEWPDEGTGSPIRAARRPDQRPRWGLGLARLVADSLGGVMTAPGPVSSGTVGAALGFGAPRLSVAVASTVAGRIERASRPWDEETGLAPGAVLDRRAAAAVEAAEIRRGEIGYADILRSRHAGRRVWLGVAPQSSLGRARDVLRGLQHERALLVAPEPHATRISALAAILASVLDGQATEAVPATTWEHQIGPACRAMDIEPPVVSGDRLRYPDPAVTAYLLGTVGGDIAESPAMGENIVDAPLILRPSNRTHRLAILMGNGSGAIPLCT